MTAKGYIKLHRKLLDDVVFASPELLKVWVWCLIKASYRDYTQPLSAGNKLYEVPIKRGQFVTGSRAAAGELDMPKTSVHRRLEKLEQLGKIGQEVGQHFRVITIEKWGTYQLQEVYSGTDAGQMRDRCGTDAGPNKKLRSKEYKESINAPNVADATPRSLFEGLDFKEKHGRRKRYLGTKNFDCGVIYDQKEKRLIFDGDTSWIDTYNAAGNPRAEVEQAEQWLAAHLPGRGSKDHYRRFLVNWLKSWHDRELEKSKYIAQKHGGLPLTTIDDASKAWSELQNHVKTALPGALPRDKATRDALDALGGLAAFLEKHREAKAKGGDLWSALQNDFKKAYRGAKNS